MKRTFVTCALLGATGCVNHAFSPPARILTLESAEVPAEGESRLGVEAGAYGVIFGPTLVSASARYRRGIGSDLELNVEGSGVLVADTPNDAEQGTLGVALRGGMKYRIAPWIALTGGLGGGAYTGGGFFAPDAGLVIAYENPYIVPFLSGRVSLSSPIGVRAIDIGNEDPELAEATTTLVVGGTVGARIPIDGGSLLGGVGVTELYDGNDDAAALSAMLAFESVL